MTRFYFLKCILAIPFRIFHTPELLTLYKTKIYSCLLYGSPLWRGAPKHSRATLDEMQKRPIRII